MIDIKQINNTLTPPYGICKIDRMSYYIDESGKLAREYPMFMPQLDYIDTDAFMSWFYSFGYKKQGLIPALNSQLGKTWPEICSCFENRKECRDNRVVMEAKHQANVQMYKEKYPQLFLDAPNVYLMYFGKKIPRTEDARDIIIHLPVSYAPYKEILDFARKNKRDIIHFAADMIWKYKAKSSPILHPSMYYVADFTVLRSSELYIQFSIKPELEKLFSDSSAQFA